MCSKNNCTGKCTCNKPSFIRDNEQLTLLQEIFTELDHQLGTHATGKPLNDTDKNSNRDQARDILKKTGPPKIPGCTQELKKKCAECERELHHIVPLQFAHLQPTSRPNRRTNMLLLPKAIHDAQDAREKKLKNDLDAVDKTQLPDAGKLRVKRKILEDYRKGIYKLHKKTYGLPSAYGREEANRNRKGQKTPGNSKNKTSSAKLNKESILDEIFAEVRF